MLDFLLDLPIAHVIALSVYFYTYNNMFVSLFMLTFWVFVYFNIPVPMRHFYVYSFLNDVIYSKTYFGNIISETRPKTRLT